MINNTLKSLDGAVSVLSNLEHAGKFPENVKTSILDAYSTLKEYNKEIQSVLKSLGKNNTIELTLSFGIKDVQQQLASAREALKVYMPICKAFKVS